jgi:hypothetical protein
LLCTLGEHIAKTTWDGEFIQRQEERIEQRNEKKGMMGYPISMQRRASLKPLNRADKAEICYREYSPVVMKR